MTAEIELRIRAQSDQAEARLASLEGKSSRLGRVLKTAVVAGTAAAAYGITRLGVASVKAASDSEQSLGATETVFGKYADRVVSSSQRAARALGLSANEYRELSNVTGAMLKSSGLPLRKVTGLTKDLNERAADVAATFGGTTREAVEAFGSLLRGEADPVERYGVSIKQSDVNARLAAQGLDKLEGKAKKQAEQQARLDLLFRQTADSAGTFRKESNTLAGQTQRLSAQSDNLLATIGQGLTPGLATLAKTVGRDVLPPMQKLAEKYAPRLGEELGDLAEAAGPKVEAALLAIPRALTKLDRSGGSDSLSEIADAAGELGPPLADAAAELPSLADVLKVTATVMGAAADNADLLAKALPYLAAGYAAVKVAQAASNAARLLQVPLKISELRVNRQLVASNRALVASRTGETTATTVNTRAKTVNAAATRGATTATVAYTGATRASTGALAANTLAAGRSAGRITRMGRVARVAGGAAGIGALALASSSATGEMSTLGRVGGGALLGFSVAGPVGAAIGAGAGLILDVASASEKAAVQTVRAKDAAKGYGRQLDLLTGKIGKQTRAHILNELRSDKSSSKAVTAARRLGISSRTVVGAVEGQSGAWDKLNGKLQRAERVYANLDNKESARGRALAAAIFRVRTLTSDINEQSSALVRSGAKVQGAAAAYKKLPKRVQTEIKQVGGGESRKRIAQLARQYRLTPKQVRTLIKATGSKATLKEVRSVQKSLRAAGRVQPDFNPWKRGLGRNLNQGKSTTRKGMGDLEGLLKAGTRGARPNLDRWQGGLSRGMDSGRAKARRGTQAIAGALATGTARARPELGPFASSLAGRISAMRGTASSGGSGIGSALGSGVASGVRGWIGTIASTAASLVNNAIAAAKRAAQSRSPSKRTIRLGRDIGRGLQIGLRRSRKITGREARALGNLVIRQASSGYKALTAAETKYLKQQQLTDKQRRRAISRTKDERRALVRNARAQAKVAEKIKAARQEANEYAKGIRETYAAFGNVTAFVDAETGTLTSRDLLDRLKDRVAAADRFAALIDTLRGSLNATTLRQLIDAGPEAGLATAEALAAGGASAVAEVNALTKRLEARGKDLGVSAQASLYGAGKLATEGLVAGLEAKSTALDKAARRIANRLVKQVRSSLGIKSPSRVFRDLGEQTMRGLEIGLDETYARRAGRATAKALVDGYGQPKLTADASRGAAAPVQVSVRLTAEQVSQLQRGRQIELDLAAYRGAGGRRL